MKKLFLCFLILLFSFFLFYKKQIATHSSVANTKVNPSRISSSHVCSTPAPKESSLFSKILEKNNQRAVSFLSYPPAPLQGLSEREASNFPGAHVVEFSELVTPYFKVHQRILETSLKDPYLRTEELIDRDTGNLVARLEMVANQFLVVLPEQQDPQKFLQQLGPQALFITRMSESRPIYRVALREASLASLPAALQQVQESSGGSIAGEPDYIVHSSQRPQSYAYGYQWGLWKVNQFNSFQKPYQPLLDCYCYYFDQKQIAIDSYQKPQDDFFEAQNFGLLSQESSGASEKIFAKASKLAPVEPDPSEYPCDYFFSERGINAEDAWNIRTSAASVIVAVVDSGIRYTHANLKKNMWHNPNPDPKLHDIYGKNFVENNGDPMDHDGHGTHCAGIIGGSVNNCLGTSGVAWEVQLMACKYGEDEGGTESNVVSALDYAQQHHADIVNCSFCINAYVCVSGPKKGEIVAPDNVAPLLNALKEELSSLHESGIIVVAAAGNTEYQGRDNDAPVTMGQDYQDQWIYQSYPSGYSTELDNIVSVAATDYFEGRHENDFSNFQDKEGLAYFSNYGAQSVSLAAPGAFILSTYNTSDESYAFLDGTSMAAPFVSGALALMKAEFPNYSYRELIDHLLETTDHLPSLEGKMKAGRLNLARALWPTLLIPQFTGITPPPPIIPSTFPKTGVQDPTSWWY